MAAEFKLTIRLGNAAMLTGLDIAEALGDVADKIFEWGDDQVGSIGISPRTIYDANGNPVGEWGVGRA